MRTARLLLVAVLALGCGGDDDGPRVDGAPGRPDSGAGPDADTSRPDGGGNTADCDPVEGQPSLTLELVAEGFEEPVFVTSPPNDPRLFIIEQEGRIYILKDGAVLPTEFLNVEAQNPDISGNDERGLLGLAFHPQYADNGRFYVFYRSQDSQHVVEEYQVSAANPDVADPATAQTIFSFDDDYSNHNGGTVLFSPIDGFLYASIGDGGDGGGPEERARYLDNHFGKIHRFDVTTLPATAPADNPFVDTPDALDSIYLYGLRNPYRFSFDRETGDMYIADVGQGAIEEIDVHPVSSPGGENYGWDMYEGTSCFEGPCSPNGIVMPVYEYGRSDGNCTVGGYVYRGCKMPGYHGTYFFSDFNGGWVRSFEWDGAGGFTNERDWGDLSVGNIASLGEDADGELYVVKRNSGQIFRIVPQ